jgi:ATPase family associated with various cellular activities (AAA)
MHDIQTVGASELVPTLKYDAGLSYWASYLAGILARGLPHERRLHWDTTAANLDELLVYATHSSRLAWGAAVQLDLENESGCFAAVSLASGGGVTVHLAAETIAALGAGEAFLRERLPERKPTEDQTVPIVFWSYGCYGPSEMARSIDVPTWSEIRGNYPTRVAGQLERLMSPDYRPHGRGQLILWYGPPGTGKTYGLRALGWEWREWCSFHYVTDPETFFGKPDYMLEVILEGENNEEVRASKKWKLLILEDTGELLAADAKAQTGQGLSRLLNVVDGIIGQGLHVIALVTTNDHLRQLHPAVARPGRCLAKIEFVPFTSREAKAWRARNGVEADVGAGTLASLFGAAAGEEMPERPPVGFVR